MRHRRAGYKLGRNATHRLALYRNLALALFRHERIVTTVEKAKAVRPFVEKLITLARKAAINPEKALHARRLVLARLGTPSNAAVRPPAQARRPRGAGAGAGANGGAGGARGGRDGQPPEGGARGRAAAPEPGEGGGRRGAGGARPGGKPEGDGNVLVPPGADAPGSP